MRVMTIFGTRPEAIKMAPVVRRLHEASGITSIVCVTGQHRQMLDQVLQFFEICPDHDLNVMTHAQGLNALSATLIGGIDRVLEAAKPDRVLVHGDTTTAMAASVAAFHRRIPIGHVEAGLRTGDLQQPWPEEMNRRAIDIMADLLLAPTETARRNLLGENLGSKRITVTGNTVIDALMEALTRIEGSKDLKAQAERHFEFLRTDRKTILVTGHRRENFGAGFEGICNALAHLAERSDVQVVYPVHLNPNVREPVMNKLGGRANVHLIEPLNYMPFVYLMNLADVILTDSGGIQEEAPSLGKPVLVMREVTERPEAVEAGTVRLVGTDPQRIVSAASSYLDDPALREDASHKSNPYGDGRASYRILEELFS
jgi:UDP-N-acetylglucosamine 2-epimerase (non-hydrolysing)